MRVRVKPAIAGAARQDCKALRASSDAELKRCLFEYERSRLVSLSVGRPIGDQQLLIATVEADVKARLEDRAQTVGLGMTYLVRLAIDEYLARLAVGTNCPVGAPA